MNGLEYNYNHTDTDSTLPRQRQTPRPRSNTFAGAALPTTAKASSPSASLLLDFGALLPTLPGTTRSASVSLLSVRVSSSQWSPQPFETVASELLVATVSSPSPAPTPARAPATSSEPLSEDAAQDPDDDVGSPRGEQPSPKEAHIDQGEKNKDEKSKEKQGGEKGEKKKKKGPLGKLKESCDKLVHAGHWGRGKGRKEKDKKKKSGEDCAMFGEGGSHPRVQEVHTDAEEEVGDGDYPRGHTRGRLPGLPQTRVAARPTTLDLPPPTDAALNSQPTRTPSEEPVGDYPIRSQPLRGSLGSPSTLGVAVQALPKVPAVRPCAVGVPLFPGNVQGPEPDFPDRRDPTAILRSTGGGGGAFVPTRAPPDANQDPSPTGRGKGTVFDTLGGASVTHAAEGSRGRSVDASPMFGSKPRARASPPSSVGRSPSTLSGHSLTTPPREDQRPAAQGKRSAPADLSPRETSAKLTPTRENTFTRSSSLRQPTQATKSESDVPQPSSKSAAPFRETRSEIAGVTFTPRLPAKPRDVGGPTPSEDNLSRSVSTPMPPTAPCRSADPRARPARSVSSPTPSEGAAVASAEVADRLSAGRPEASPLRRAVCAACAAASDATAPKDPDEEVRAACYVCGDGSESTTTKDPDPSDTKRISPPKKHSLAARSGSSSPSAIGERLGTRSSLPRHSTSPMRRSTRPSSPYPWPDGPPGPLVRRASPPKPSRDPPTRVAPTPQTADHPEQRKSKLSPPSAGKRFDAEVTRVLDIAPRVRDTARESAAGAGRRCECCSRAGTGTGADRREGDRHLGRPLSASLSRSVSHGPPKRAQSSSPARRKTAIVITGTSSTVPASGVARATVAGDCKGPLPSASTRSTRVRGRARTSSGQQGVQPQHQLQLQHQHHGVGLGSSTYSPWNSMQQHQMPPWDFVALENEVQELRRELQARRTEELRLRREIHKLRSVLQQATSFSRDGEGEGEGEGGGPEEGEGGVGGEERHGILLTSLQATHSMAGGRVGGGGDKKQGVSGESSGADPASSTATLTTFPKDFRSQQLIKAAILDNDFLKNLARSQIKEMVDCMFPQQVAQGSYVIREGDAGSLLYVLAEGEMEVLKEDTVLGRMGPGKAFGELAILYNCTRTASIRAVTDLQLWVLDRKVFQQIMMRTGIQRLEENLSFLRSVPLLKNLSEATLVKLADVLELEFYPADTYIVRQGASGHTFFIISGGSVRVTQRVPGSGEEMVIRTLERGDYFGEQALLHDDCRTASVLALPPGVECLTLDREPFLALIGSLSELQEKDYGDEVRQGQVQAQLSRRASLDSASPTSLGLDHEVESLRLEDLHVIGTLGVGGFGSVRLVTPTPTVPAATPSSAGVGAATPTRSYALKCLNKSHIVATGQQEHVLAERDIMVALHSPFIVRLHRTFRDERCVYLLLEACLGGELWTLLRDRGGLDDVEARFAVACVVEALEYLHARGVVYRDLKPENLVLDARGYVKLVDFGFSKRMAGQSKTWTFCGTPEYVAPEVILNRGHDRAVDCWALGVLVFELLAGTPPFTAADPMRTYNLILKGMEAVVMPRAVSRSAAHLIRKLCKAAPAERLGYQRGGLNDVRHQKWFQGFDWEGLKHQTTQPPIVPQVSDPTDISNFETQGKEDELAPMELHNWEADF